MSPPVRYAVPNAFLPIRARHLAGKKAAGVKDVISAGELVVPTGRVVACDPLVQPERSSFERAVPPGEYAVHLFVAKEGAMIGFAELRLRKAPIERFAIATLPGQDASTLGDNEMFGYPVDAGLGCFADEAALRRLQDADAALHKAKGASYVSYYDAVVSHELAANGRSWVSHRPDEASRENVVIFRSGEGDGTYATYFGLDADGEAVCLVTSFRCFAEPVSKDRKLLEVTANFKRLVDDVEQAIGAVLRSKGFSGPTAAYKTTSDGGEMKLEYTRDGISFEVDSSLMYRHLLYTVFRWKRGRSTFDVGCELEKAGLKLKLPQSVGDAAYTNAAKIGASYAEHWDAIERAVLGFLPLKVAKAKKAPTQS